MQYFTRVARHGVAGLIVTALYCCELDINNNKKHNHALFSASSSSALIGLKTSRLHNAAEVRIHLQPQEYMHVAIRP